MVDVIPEKKIHEQELGYLNQCDIKRYRPDVCDIVNERNLNLPLRVVSCLSFPFVGILSAVSNDRHTVTSELDSPIRRFSPFTTNSST